MCLKAGTDLKKDGDDSDRVDTLQSEGGIKRDETTKSVGLSRKFDNFITWNSAPVEHNINTPTNMKYLIMYFLLLGICLSAFLLEKSLVLTSKTKWIHLCEADFYNQLHTRLDFNVQEFEQIVKLTDEFYTLTKFTDEKHNILMAAIVREIKFKTRVQDITFEYYYNNEKYEKSYYTKAVSVQSFLIALEDVLK